MRRQRRILTSAVGATRGRSRWCDRRASRPTSARKPQAPCSNRCVQRVGLRPLPRPLASGRSGPRSAVTTCARDRSSVPANPAPSWRGGASQRGRARPACSGGGFTRAAADRNASITPDPHGEDMPRRRTSGRRGKALPLSMPGDGGCEARENRTSGKEIPTWHRRFRQLPFFFLGMD